MKRFGFEVDGRPYHFRQLTQEAKEDILDFMVAGRLKAAQRMHKKGYLDPAGFIDAKQGAYIKWGTEAWLTELADDENAKKFVRALVVEDLDDPTCLRLVREQRDPDSDMAGAMRRMQEDADPKATPRPPSGSTPTAGAASS